MKRMKDENIICDTLTEHCENLNNAHKDKAKHRVMEKTIPYQRYIGAMEELNILSKSLGCHCYCKELGTKGKHTGHRMVKR